MFWLWGLQCFCVTWCDLWDLLRNVGFAWLKLNQTDENPRLELRITATDDGYVTEEGLNAMQLGAFGTGRAVLGSRAHWLLLQYNAVNSRLNIQQLFKSWITQIQHILVPSTSAAAPDSCNYISYPVSFNQFQLDVSSSLCSFQNWYHKYILNTGWFPHFAKRCLKNFVLAQLNITYLFLNYTGYPFFVVHAMVWPWRLPGWNSWILSWNSLRLPVVKAFSSPSTRC